MARLRAIRLTGGITRCCGVLRNGTADRVIVLTAVLALGAAAGQLFMVDRSAVLCSCPSPPTADGRLQPFGCSRGNDGSRREAAGEPAPLPASEEGSSRARAPAKWLASQVVQRGIARETPLSQAAAPLDGRL